MLLVTTVHLTFVIPHFPLIQSTNQKDPWLSGEIEVQIIPRLDIIPKPYAATNWE